MTKDKRVAFLEEILEIAEANPKIIADGRLVFSYNGYEESMKLAVHLDTDGKAYFMAEVRIDDVRSRTDTAERALERISRYVPDKYPEFVKDFHIYYRTKEKRLFKDLLSKITKNKMSIEQKLLLSP